MTFIEDMQERDLALLQALDGREVTYSPQSGSPVIISGMLQALTELSSGETVDVVAARPVLSVRSVDVTGIDVGDQFTIDGQDYEVMVIQPDNEGITELIMEVIS